MLPKLISKFLPLHGPGISHNFYYFGRFLLRKNDLAHLDIHGSEYHKQYTANVYTQTIVMV